MGITELTYSEMALSAIIVVVAGAALWLAWTALKYKELAEERERDVEEMEGKIDSLERTLLQVCGCSPPPRGKKHHVKNHR